MGLNVLEVGDHIMRKMFFLILVSMAFSWPCRMVCAKSEGGAKVNSTRKSMRRRGALDPNQMRMREKALELREKHAKNRREQLDKMRKDEIGRREKARKMRDLQPAAGADGNEVPQLAAMNKKLRHETAKHEERMAKLSRMRELALKKKSKELTGRIDRLLLKENQRYGRKIQKTQMQKRKFMRMGTRQRGGPGAKGTGPGKGMRPPMDKRFDNRNRRPELEKKKAVSAPVEK